ncbi:rRNA methylase [Owenweeksia hongkongensis DSM 17368]|uniref:rRNA methylase n=1 Tax=Owenweeksia hongkongensis (strain DSM 17368 / CIP 108786 / JCM 12287 / NRRL B-23963 / UST20020801) TaxID=926562 RepID=G8R1Z2_OWEHD|nr:RNA methyltransferase [Owenweeksia hongkongensis]AEV33942.1 rRNA methylase [Owenweeksia hongkongensis DSM 17368]
MRKLRMSELNRLSTEEFQEAPKNPIVLVLDNVRSLLNVGSVFRTSDAFRVEELHLCGLTATPPHREMNKTALGATESVSWRHFVETSDSLKDLKEKGYTLIAIEQTSGAISLEQFPFEQHDKVALIFGNEVKGVSNEALALCDFAIEIPQFGTKHSLNISVSAGIALWQAAQRFI